jgi:putative SOS response-associated peptidase YedK
MCNLYSVTKGQTAIIQASRAMRDTTGNLPPLPGIFPDYTAPIVRNAPDGLRELCMVGGACPAEYADTNPRKTPTWFAFSEERPLAFFAGLWTRWKGIRGPKANPIEGEHTLFGFLTTEATDVVGAIHPKAMPVILTRPEDIELWMSAPAEEALELQRPLPDGVLSIIARGERQDAEGDVNAA